MAESGISVVGVYQSDFAKKWNADGGQFVDLTREAVFGATAQAGLPLEAIETIHVGNAFGELYTGQGHYAAMPATAIPELWGVPAGRHEAACASSSIATLAAMAELKAGIYDCALVLGIEIETTLRGLAAAEAQNAAAWVTEESAPEGVAMWSHVFNELAGEYERRYGLDTQHLRAIGKLNYENAQNNPNAQTRNWDICDEDFGTDDARNPLICGRLRRKDVTHITDGAAALLLVSDRWLEKNAKRYDVRPLARITGWGHTTAGLGLNQKLIRYQDSEYVMPHVRKAILAAFQRAQISDALALSGIETHDCMSSSEYLAIDHFGLTKPGESWQAVEEGIIERTGRLPINAGGGLIGGGHPVGATGARMIVDASKQVAGLAGDYQIESAQKIATLNIGGSTSTVVSFIIEQV